MKQQSLRKYLSDLVAFQTESGQYEAAAELLSYVKNFADERGYHTTEFVSNDFPGLIIRTSNSQHAKVTLQAHIDVVSADDSLFRLIADDDKLLGRGVYDMKFAAACYLQLLDELAETKDQYDFAVLLTSDEELGGEDGVRYALDNDYTTDVCILPDGGDNWEIEERAKGACLAVIEATGTSAHGSRPWEGDNASQKVIAAVAEMQQLNTNKPEGITVSATQLKSDTAINQIPDTACISLDVRFMMLDEYEEIHQQLKDIAAKYDCTVTITVFIEPMTTDLKNPFVAQFIESAKLITNKAIGSRLSLGASDGRFFARKNIPVVIMRPKGGGAHSDDEWISEQSMEEYYNVIKHYVSEAAKKR